MKVRLRERRQAGAWQAGQIITAGFSFEWPRDCRR
jgi:hypothetical protein